MPKAYRNSFIFFAVILIVLLFFLKKYNDIIAKNRIDDTVSQNIQIINNDISYQKKHALSLAILFSKNQNIIKALNSHDANAAKEELNTLLGNIKNYTDIKNLQIQIHTKDSKVFVRSWEDKDTGLDLRGFRKGVVKVKKTERPFVSNELGKRINIKAISPVFDDKGEFAGSLEVITDYTLIKDRLKYMGIDIMPLLHKSHLDIAKYHRSNRTLGDYVLVERNYDKKLYDLILHNRSIFDSDKLYHELSNKIVVLMPLRDMDKDEVGFIAASFDKDKKEFSYLPRYEYSGAIPAIKEGRSSNSFEKREVSIR